MRFLLCKNLRQVSFFGQNVKRAFAALPERRVAAAPTGAPALGALALGSGSPAGAEHGSRGGGPAGRLRANMLERCQPGLILVEGIQLTHPEPLVDPGQNLESLRLAVAFEPFFD